MTMPNFCINFLNKAAKLLTILYDFAVASYMDAWIKKNLSLTSCSNSCVASYMDAWIKKQIMLLSRHRDWRRILHGCVD